MKISRYIFYISLIVGSIVIPADPFKRAIDDNDINKLDELLADEAEYSEAEYLDDPEEELDIGHYALYAFENERYNIFLRLIQDKELDINDIKELYDLAMEKNEETVLFLLNHKVFPENASQQIFFFNEIMVKYPSLTMVKKLLSLINLSALNARMAFDMLSPLLQNSEILPVLEEVLRTFNAAQVPWQDNEVLQEVIHNDIDLDSKFRQLEMLLRYGADINKLGEEGSTVLHYAAEGGYDTPGYLTALIRFLLLHGADPRVIDNYGYTALDYAIRHGHREDLPELITLLVGHGAPTNTVIGGESLIDRIAARGSIAALEAAAEFGITTEAILREILAKKGIEGIKVILRSAVKHAENYEKVLNILRLVLSQEQYYTLVVDTISYNLMTDVFNHILTHMHLNMPLDLAVHILQQDRYPWLNHQIADTIGTRVGSRLILIRLKELLADQENIEKIKALDNFLNLRWGTLENSERLLRIIAILEARMGGTAAAGVETPLEKLIARLKKLIASQNTRSQTPSRKRSASPEAEESASKRVESAVPVLASTARTPIVGRTLDDIVASFPAPTPVIPPMMSVGKRSLETVGFRSPEPKQVESTVGRRTRKPKPRT